MVAELRKRFNENFTEEKYQEMVGQVENLHPGSLDFRNAETPVFVPADFTAKMLATCEDIIDFFLDPRFKEYTERSIPENVKVPGETSRPEFIVFDFGVCALPSGEMVPQLIELQGFPSLYAFQAAFSEIVEKYADVPESFSSYLNGYDRNSYNQLLRELIVGEHQKENVVLLEIFPEKQKTRLDFYCTEDVTGIKTICLTELIAEGDQLFYMNKGVKTRIKRIFNRLIFDDLHQQEGWEKMTDLTKAFDVEWAPHPNWFYRISKFTLPFLSSPFVPDAFFLNELKEPLNLKNFVLKPLFSFAGMGVVIDVTQEDIDRIEDPQNWILQKKVEYAPVIETPDEPAKAEIRLFYFWKKEWDRPKAIHNLARLSKGKMIGTRYNKNKTWVGGSIAYFETSTK